MTSATTAALDYRPQPRGESQMKITPGMPIRISMPSGMPEKYPRFAAAFNGRFGKVVKIATLRGIEIEHAIIIDIAVYPKERAKGLELLGLGISRAWIYVERSWLSRVKPI